MNSAKSTNTQKSNVVMKKNMMYIPVTQGEGNERNYYDVTYKPLSPAIFVNLEKYPEKKRILNNYRFLYSTIFPSIRIAIPQYSNVHKIPNNPNVKYEPKIQFSQYFKDGTFKGYKRQKINFEFPQDLSFEPFHNDYIEEVKDAKEAGENTFGPEHKFWSQLLFLVIEFEVTGKGSEKTITIKVHDLIFPNEGVKNFLEHNYEILKYVYSDYIFDPDYMPFGSNAGLVSNTELPPKTGGRSKLDTLTVKELKSKAKSKKISGYSTMNKKDLVHVLSKIK